MNEPAVELDCNENPGYPPELCACNCDCWPTPHAPAQATMGPGLPGATVVSRR
jgi:hypothetical protein